MNTPGAGKYLRLFIFVTPFLITSCAKKDPTFTDLWNNRFNQCGVSCHSGAIDGTTDKGPVLTTKTEFYNNLVNKNVTTDYPDWVSELTGNCNSVNFITPGDANQSTLAASLIQSVSTALSTSNNSCDTSYNVHSQVQVTISDSTASDLIKWINAGAKND